MLSLHGLPSAQIAELLDCYPATVRRWIRHPEGLLIGVLATQVSVGAGSSSRWKIARWTVQRSGCGRALISCQGKPGKRTRRSLTYSPRLSELLAGERGRVVARAGIGLDVGHGNAPAGFSPQSLQLGLHRVQLGTGNADQLGCFGAHARLHQFGASAPQV
jgi:hypothetical protein